MMYQLNDEEPESSSESEVERESSDSESEVEGSGVAMVHSDATCMVREQVGYLADIDACADVCRSFDSCSFVMFDSNDGECLTSSMQDIDCEDGFKNSDYYDIFDVYA